MPTSLRQIGSPRLWLVPAIIALVIAGIPVLASLLLSFFVQYGSGTQYVGMDAYARLFSGPYVVSLVHILRRAVIVATGCMIFALPVGYFVATRRSPVMRISLIALALAPFFTSDVIRAFGWFKILSADGILSKALVFLSGGLLGSQQFCFSDMALLLALASAVFPFGMIAVIVSLPKATDPVWLASADLGGSRRWTFLHLAVPSAAPGALVGWLYMLVLATFSSAEEHYVGNSTSMQKIASGLINSDVGDSSYQFFALTSTILLALMGLALIAAALLRYRSSISTLISKCIILSSTFKKWFILVFKLSGSQHVQRFPQLSRADNSQSIRSDNIFNFFLWTISSFAYLLILSPLFVTLVLSLQDARGDTLSWTLHHYQGFFHAQTLTTALGRSAVLALGVGCACALITTLLATIKWQPKKVYIPVLLIVAIASLIPPDSYSIALLQVVRFLGVQSGSLWLVAISHIAWAIPFCVGTMFLSYSALNVWVLKAAIELEPRPLSLWVRIIARLTIPAILGCLVFGVLLSLNDFIRGIYLGGSAEFLSTRVYGRLLSGLAESGRQIFACATLVVMFSFFVATAGLAFITRTSHSR